MIDFRYHLVSLVSVFLALAVGIVLGAGPLKESIGDTLTDQVQKLRAEKDDLRAELDATETAVQHRDDFTTALTPKLVSGALAGRSVVLVLLPGVDDSVLDDARTGLKEAGGGVTGVVTVRSEWTDSSKAALRDQLATQLESALPAGAGGGSGSSSQRLAGLLARSVVVTGTGSSGAGQAQTVLEGLKDAKLIDLDGDVATRASAALVFAPGHSTGTATPSIPAAATSAYLDLTSALDAAGNGAVLSGPSSSADTGGLVAAARDDADLRKAVSTVDTGGSPMGVVTAVLALKEQLAGGSGRYGFGDGATAVLPAGAAS